MTQVEQLASFVAAASYDALSTAARRGLKHRVLDSLGCAFGALGAEPMRMVRANVEDLGGSPRCTLIGGGRSAPDRAAFYNGGLVRYLDFNDTYLAKGESCHPSDNFAPVLAAAEYAGADGKELLAALAVAYQVQCRLSDVAPVRGKGFDHTTQGNYAAAAGVSRALRLGPAQTAHAIAIAGTSLNALRVTRTGRLSHWKGLAYPATAMGATHAAFLAMRGVTGPLEVFEGNKGFMESIAGKFEIDWAREDLERVTRTGIKKYNAEYHSQSVLEGILAMRAEHGLRAEQVARIEIDIFDVAYHIIGGGEEGDKKLVCTKEEADHSLPYIVAVALLDGQVMPDQYCPERIARPDVQDLLRKVAVRPSAEYSRQFPQQMACSIRVLLTDGRTLTCEKADYEGFYTRPLSWSGVVQKFERLTAARLDAPRRGAMIETVENLETSRVAELTTLLECGGLPPLS
jgi:2-methylcitrate dehydratase